MYVLHPVTQARVSNIFDAAEDFGGIIEDMHGQKTEGNFLQKKLTVNGYQNDYL